MRPAFAFEVWITLIFVVSFAPASGWLMNRLVASSGQFAVSDHDLLAFATSLPGIFFVLLSVAFALAFWFAEQAGLLVIVVNAACGKKVPVSLVLWSNMARLPALLRLGLLQAVGYVGLGIPFGFGIWLTYRLLLGEWDFYFYLNVRPSSWWIALAVSGTLLAVYLLLAAWLYIRWLLSVPALVFENATATAALRASWQQTRGRFREFGVPLAVWWLVVLLSSLAVTWLIRAVAGQLLVDAGLTLRFVIPTVFGTLALIAVLDLVWFIIGKTVHVMLMAGFCLETTEVERKLTASTTAAAVSPTLLRTIGWLVAGIVLFMGVAAGAVFVERLDVDRTLAITAHRGSKVKAPENTLSALRQAIAEGADYAEIDVQTTADGVVVLLHDADLMRVASVNRRLRDIDYEELSHIDVGSWFAPEFNSERIPTLQEAIDAARGRIKLNIELKFTWPDPALTEKVVDIIRRNGFASDCVVSSLNFEALTETRRAAPELTIGFIVLQAVGNLARMEADFLSINAARATPRLVRDLRRRGRAIHVWNVNDLNNALSMIEMGVDNIITDYPREVRSLLEAWNELSDSEKIALMLRNLIVQMERPEPEEL